MDLREQFGLYRKLQNYIYIKMGTDNKETSEGSGMVKEEKSINDIEQAIQEYIKEYAKCYCGGDVEKAKQHMLVELVAEEKKGERLCGKNTQ